MTDQKRKSTRSFNLNKPGSSGEFDLTKEGDTPVLKGKRKLLIPIVIIGLLAVLVVGYFVLNPDNNKKVGNTENVAQLSKVEVTTQTQPLPVAASDQSTEAKNAGTVNSQTQKSTQPVIDQKVNTIQPKENKVTNDLLYKKGEAYKIYQFPFGVADYSQPNPELDKLAEVMKQNPGIKISITAFTDNIGDPEYNKVLSEQRAKAIHDYLISKGIDRSRLVSQGKGISTRYPTNAENRRAEFILI